MSGELLDREEDIFDGIGGPRRARRDDWSSYERYYGGRQSHALYEEG